MESLDENNISEDNKLNQVVEIKKARPLWLYALIGVVVLLVVALIGWFVIRTYFFEESKEKKQDLTISKEFSPETIEAQKKMEETFRKIAEQSSPEYILKTAYENFSKISSFYYHEEIIREDVEETEGVQHIVRSYPTDTKKAYVVLPDKVFLRNGYFTEIILDKDQVHIKNDAVLDNYFRSFFLDTANQQNLSNNERLVFELTNLQFNWLNPDIIKEIEKKERNQEEGHKYTVIYVEYDIDKLKSLWQSAMKSQINSSYLEGFNLDLPNLQINYRGEIWIEDSSTPLPEKIIINRSFKSDSQKQNTFHISKMTSYINFKEYNKSYSISSSDIISNSPFMDIYSEDIKKDQGSFLVVNEDTPLVFPIHAGSRFISGLNMDGLDIFVYNPFEWPIDIILEQSLPQGVWVDNATFDWTIVEHKIVWHHLLDKKQIVSFRVNFKLETEETIDMPQAQLMISAKQLTESLNFICPEKLQVGNN